MINTFNTLAITWDAFMKAATYQLTGMIVVFGCLVLLWIILEISGAVATRQEAKRKAEADAARAVELLTEAGAAEVLILDAQKCAEETASYLTEIEEQVAICQSYVDSIYAKAAEGNISKEEIDKYLTKEEEVEIEEVEEVNPYLVDNGNIVAVTYGDKAGTTITAYKTFILNYNNFAVTVTYDVDGETRIYTIPANEYVVIQH